MAEGDSGAPEHPASQPPPVGAGGEDGWRFVRWLVKNARDETLTPEERLSVVANFPVEEAPLTNGVREETKSPYIEGYLTDQIDAGKRLDWFPDVKVGDAVREETKAGVLADIVSAFEGASDDAVLNIDLGPPRVVISQSVRLGDLRALASPPLGAAVEAHLLSGQLQGLMVARLCVAEVLHPLHTELHRKIDDLIVGHADKAEAALEALANLEPR